MHGHAVGVHMLCYTYMHCLLQVRVCSSSFRLSLCNPLVILGGKWCLLSGKGSSRPPRCVIAETAHGRSSLKAWTCEQAVLVSLLLQLFVSVRQHA